MNLYCLINAESVDTRIMVVHLSDWQLDNVKISDFSIFGTLHLQNLSKDDY